MSKHFGCDIRTKEPYLTRENYIHSDREFRDWYGEYDSDLFSSIDQRVECAKKEALLNFDLNMAYYNSLEQSSFDSFVDEKLGKNPSFIDVSDLNDYKCPGLYILVLGQYKQIYVGISKNIKKRVQQHWAIYKDLSRLIWGGMLDSKLSIDSFRAMDTTRIFVHLKHDKKNDLWDEEYKLVEFIPDCYSCNRMGGGEPMSQILSGNLFKTADLPRVTEDNINRVLPDYSWKMYCDIVDFRERTIIDRQKHYMTQEELWAKREAEFEERQRQEKEVERKREEHYSLIAEQLKAYGFSAEEDFPDGHYRHDENFNLDAIKNRIDKSISKGYDISIYKGLLSREIAKVYYCLEKGVSAERALQLAKTYKKLSDLRFYFKRIRCLELRAEGFSIRKISEDVGLSEYIVKKILKEEGAL